MGNFKQNPQQWDNKGGTTQAGEGCHQGATYKRGGSYLTPKVGTELVFSFELRSILALKNILQVELEVRSTI